MKKQLFLLTLSIFLTLTFATISNAQAPTTDLIITGVIDGPLSGGRAKAVEFYALNNIADLSTYGFGSANNGGGSDGQEYTFPADSLAAGTFIYVATESTGFTNFFGFAPTYTNGSAPNINGDDAIELFKSGSVVDVFGDINTDGTGQAWEYMDGWAYRVDETGPDGNIFTLANWSFSNPNALDGESTNATATTPFPTATYQPAGSPPATTTVIINEVDADTPGTDIAEFIELYDSGTGNTDLSGLSIVLFNGSDDKSYLSFDLDGYTTDANGYFVLCGDAANLINCDLDVTPNSNLIQNGADAVALYQDDAVNFPNDTPITTTHLIDAIVYDTNDSDDSGLLPLLNPGQPQVNEDGGGAKDTQSNQRCDNGTGGARNTDTYTQATPSPGDTNTCAITPPVTGCGDPAILIHDIQGSGTASPMVGDIVTIEGIVVGDFQLSTELKSFYLQEENSDIDANNATSEGILVYDNEFGVDVAVGDTVRVTGTVGEYYNNTRLSGLSTVTVCQTGSALLPANITPASITFPVSAVADLEAYEGMAVTFPQNLTITENYNLGRYGQLTLSPNRLMQPTQVVTPGTVAINQLDLNNRSRILLDDASNIQNPDPIRYPAPGLTATDTLRSGYTLSNLVGVLDYAYGDYRVEPTTILTFTESTNPRTSAPANVNGTLKIASFNVLNYFNGDGLGGGFPTSRGADTTTEFTRQRNKIISAIVAINADIVGLMEIENDGYSNTSAIADLVNGLNNTLGAGTYAYINPGVPQIGTDAIAVGLIYKTATVTATGNAAILDSSVDPTFIDTKNRPSLAQTFTQPNGATLTVVVNHLKSKGSNCDALGDPDTGDGQGNCNLTRTNAATAIVNWLATDPTNSGDTDYIIIGDLNSYAKEDPINAFKTGGFTNLTEDYHGLNEHSYIFNGQAGTLDYALVNNTLASQVTGINHWHINTDEPHILDYNEEYKSTAQLNYLYLPGPYRASDHDPVIVGLNLTAPTPAPTQYTVFLPLILR